MTVNNLAPYPQTVLRISASYQPTKVGEVLLAGQPENVEIELNELPEDGLADFIAELVASLFRYTPAGTFPTVRIDDARTEVPA